MMATTILASMFWASLLLLGYLYIGYPFLALVRARLFPRTFLRRTITPRVTVVVVAHNEAERIERRIHDLLALDYPPDRLDVIVASDGSTDDTAARARASAGTRVSVKEFSARRGKAAVINDVMRSTPGDIVVLADARQLFEAGSLKTLMSNFNNPMVGAVSGALMFSDGVSATGAGISLYWRYEKFIRRCESRVDSTIGATGAMYAIRRGLFEPIPADTILDDVLIPMRIARRGFRVLFDGDARAVDAPSETARQEFRRKTRTIAGTFQLFWRERWLFDPRRNRLWLQTLSHKFLRLGAPVLQGVVLACSVGLRDAMVYQLLLVGQGIFYSAALAGWLASFTLRATRAGRVLTVPYAICLLNVATIVAFIRFAGGRQQVTWERTTLPGKRVLLRS